MKDGHDGNRSSIASGIHKSERLHPENEKNRENLTNLKDGHDGNKTSIASGIHKSKRLHSDKKENKENLTNHERWA
jgi:hypothetical protein